jgi:hypothetical protein
MADASSFFLHEQPSNLANKVIPPMKYLLFQRYLVSDDWSCVADRLLLSTYVEILSSLLAACFCIFVDIIDFVREVGWAAMKFQEEIGVTEVVSKQEWLTSAKPFGTTFNPTTHLELRLSSRKPVYTYSFRLQSSIQLLVDRLQSAVMYSGIDN